MKSISLASTGTKQFIISDRYGENLVFELRPVKHTPHDKRPKATWHQTRAVAEAISAAVNVITTIQKL